MPYVTSIREYLDRMAEIPPEDWTTDQHAEAMSLLWRALGGGGDFDVTETTDIESNLELLQASPLITLNVNIDGDASPKLTNAIVKMLNAELERTI